MSVASPVDHRSSTPGDEPRRTIRRDEFYQLCNIQRKLEKLDKTIMVDDADLAELSIIRGAQLDLEDDDPLDFDMRFFLPGTVEAMETALANVDWRWPQLEPIETPKNADLCWLKYSNITSDARCDARDHMDWVTRAAEATHSWERNRYAYKASPHVDERWVTSEDRWRHHMFAGWGVFMWPPGSRAWDARHPDIPHAIATLYDITSPRRSCKLLRSELLQAVTLLKSQIRDDKLIDHQFYPVLVISYHDRFTARVMQAHLYNGKMVVRPSRLLNMHTNTVSPDVRLALRWLNARPVGDTRWPGDAATQVQDDKIALKVQERAALPRQPIPFT